MKIKQIILLVFGVILVFFIYRLPKVLVADSTKLGEEESVTASPAKPEFQEIHSTAVSEKDKNLLFELKKQLNSFSESEKKVIFADSIANLFKRIGLYDSSATYFAYAAQLIPDIGQLEKAGDAYVKAFSATNGKVEALNKSAQSFYQQVIGKQPENFEVKAKLAMTFISSKNPMQGITMLREILKKDPRNETAVYNMGVLSIESGQYDKAVERFKDLLKINPNHANGHFYLGLTYLNLGKKAMAKEEFEKAKDLNTDRAFQSIVDGYLKEIE